MSTKTQISCVYQDADELNKEHGAFQITYHTKQTFLSSGTYKAILRLKEEKRQTTLSKCNQGFSGQLPVSEEELDRHRDVTIRVLDGSGDHVEDIEINCKH